MKVRCIATGDHAFIEIGEEYEVIENREGLYQLKNGNNQHYSYGKELFEVVEDKEVVKIKEWKQLDSCSNEKYIIRVHCRCIYIRKLPDDSTKSESLLIDTLDFATEEVIGMLKSVGFNIEFQKSPLEQVKDEVESLKRYAEEASNPYMYKHVSEEVKTGLKRYFEGAIEMAKDILRAIERIEKDETNT